MPLQPGERAPAFRLRGIDNEHWILGNPDRRRSVLLVFFRREVSPCRVMLPFIERLNRRSRTRDAEIIGISLDDQRDTLEFATDYSFTFPILIETPRRSVFDEYRIEGVPTLYRLDADLTVADLCVGWSPVDFERIARGFLDAAGALVTSVWEESDIVPEKAPPSTIGGHGVTKEPRGG